MDDVAEAFGKLDAVALLYAKREGRHTLPNGGRVRSGKKGGDHG